MSAASGLFLIFALLALWLAVNVQWPLYAPAPLAVVSFFAGWLTGELAVHHLVAQASIMAAFVAVGGAAEWPGWVALGALAASFTLLVVAHRRARGASGIVDRALRDALGERYDDAIGAPFDAWLHATLPRARLAFPFPVRRDGVERVRHVTFHADEHHELRLDVLRARTGKRRCPTLIYVHGGAWVIGQKQYQGLPLMQHLASLGWVCFSVDYRLSPRATFPDHLVDVKRAIAWVRAHADAWGADPDFIVLAGNSAGGHLAALAALTPNDAEYQPGFESADTRVSACVTFYGIYDFADRHGASPNAGMQRLVAKHVMKATLDVARDAYDKASPIARVHAGAPPFFVVHGERDTLAPARGARVFAEALRAVSRAVVLHVEVPGAQHAFEIFPSPRTAAVVRGVAAFVAHVYVAHRAVGTEGRP